MADPDRPPGPRPTHQPLAFGPFVIDPLRAELTRDGRTVPLRPKAFDLLLALASRPGVVRGKDELLAAVWPGVVVGEDSLAQCVHELRAALGDDAAALVRTVPRRGYRFDATVTIPPAAGQGTQAAGAIGTPAPPAGMSAPRPHRDRALVGGLLAMVAILVGLVSWHLARVGGDDAPPLSLVVLPLAVDGPEATPEWFAAALTADLTVTLGQLSGALVISRETAATVQGGADDPRRTAAELGVRYIVQGRARRDGDRVRLSLALVDGGTGTQRWAQHFDLERHALAAAIDDVALQVARSLNVQMIQAGGQRAARLDAAQVPADDLAMQGFAVYFRGLTRDNLQQALALFDAAVERDPRSLRGWGGVAVANGFLAALRWSSDRPAAIARVVQARQQLQSLDEHDAHTYFARMWEAALADDHEGLLLVATRMGERLPSYPHAHTFRAVALFNLGRFEECIAAADKALRLGPRDPTVAQRHAQIAACHFMRGDHGAAAHHAREAQQLNGQLPLPPLWLAAALAREGQTDAAREIVASHLQRHPGQRASDVAATLRSEHPAFAAGRTRLIESLHALGMP